MTEKELSESVESIIISTVDDFADQVMSYQELLYDKLVVVLKDLKVDSDGYILQTAENRKVLSGAQDLLDEYLPGSKFKNIVSESILTIPEIDDLNASYFDGFDGFKENRVFIKQLQTQAIESLENTLLQDGLSAQVKTPINQILNQNVNIGGSFSGMLKQLRTFIEGNDQLDGKLISYSRNILHDALFQYSRSYQSSVTNDLGLIWYRYIGGIIDHTREFCQDRNGGFFTQKEIESWASLDWSGKNPLTTESSIFILCGGFSCRHSLIPVSEVIVPKEDVERAKELGFID